MNKRSDESPVGPESSDEERLDSLRRDRWVPYPAGIKILMEIEDVLKTASIPGGKSRPPCLLITAPSHQGKTSILNEFYGQYLPDPDASGENAIIPVLKVQTPNKPVEGRVLDHMLDAIRVPYKKEGRLESRMNALLHALRVCLVKMIILDEIHFALACTDLQQTTFGNLLRYISNELRISIVAVGTEEADKFVASQSNLKTRFRTLRLPVWVNDKDFAAFLDKFEHTLLLRKESKLAGDTLRSMLYKLSGGITGDLVNLLTRAAALAIMTHEERITTVLLDQIKG